MGWAVGDDGSRRGRFIGYDVPATCDHPDCNAAIDRGMSYACGGGVMEDLPNCGLHFCERHLGYVERGNRQGSVCERCAKGEDPFPAKPDTEEWTQHVLTDESWATFRAENPNWRGYEGEAAT